MNYKYVWKPDSLGATEERYKLLEVNAKVIMDDLGDKDERRNENRNQKSC